MELVATQGEARHYPLHAHIRHRTFGFVHRGCVRLETAGGGERLVGGGEGFYLRQGEPHSLSVFQDTRLHVLCVGDCGAEERAVFFSSVAESRAALVQGVERLAATEPPDGPWGNLREAGVFTGTGRVPAQLARAVRETAGLLASFPEENRCVEELAEKAGYSAWYFLRGFHMVIGMTPHRFQQICRLHLLRSLLRADTALAELAVSAGFSDQSHMHKVFKQHHGLTPQQFKRSGFRVPC